MCGIMGLIGNPEPHLHRFRSALRTLRHRGPDDEGIIASESVLLGSRRLAIIDLSRAGHQPMVDEATGCTIVFNGEIYNHAELRHELIASGHTFRSRSDTEVLLKAYIAWGPKCLLRLNGMWALGIFDPQRSSLLVARDRFGVKPLFYVAAGNTVAFASEPKALLSVFPERRRVDEVTLGRFIAYSELYTRDRSFYEGVEIFPAAHYALIDTSNPRITTQRYWQLPEPEPDAGLSSSAVDDFACQFEDAVRVRLVSDVPVGLSLSGGLDSSCILAAAANVGRSDLASLTSSFAGFRTGEEDWARRAAHLKGIDVEPVVTSSEGWLRGLEIITAHMDAPGYSPAVYPMWKLMGRAGDRGLRVMLDGQGADEAFGGYPQYAALAVTEALRRGRIGSAVRGFGAHHTTFTRTEFALWILRESFPAAFRRFQHRRGGASLLRSDRFPPNWFDQEGRAPLPGLRGDQPITRRLASDITRDILPGLLHYSDAVSMSRSVELRQPFLDYRLVEWIFRAGDSVKVRDGVTKPLLRAYLQRQGMGAIASRRDKQGYPTPVGEWLREGDAAIPRNLLLSAESMLPDFCDRAAMERLIGRHARGSPATAERLYKLVSTEIWLRTCIGTQSPAATSPA